MVAQGLTNNAAMKAKKGKLGLPPELERTYHLSIVPGENSKKGFTKMRDIKAN